MSKSAVANIIRHKVGYYDFNFFEHLKVEKNPSTTLNVGVAVAEKNFHQIIYPVIRLAQCFGLFPVYGIQQIDVKDLKYRPISWKTLYSTVMMTLLIGLLTLLMRWFICYKYPDIGDRVLLSFYISSLTCIILFVRLARKWPDLMVVWTDVEQNLPKYKDRKKRRELEKRVNRITVCIMLLAFFEHILCIASNFYPIYVCKSIPNPVEYYSLMVYPYIFDCLPYNALITLVAQTLHFCYTLYWNFFDLFIIVISVVLSTRLNQITQSLRLFKGRVMPKTFWDRHRIHYLKLTELLELVDSLVSSIVLLSYAVNLYFVCVQLFRSLKPFDNIIQAIYFWFSLGFLISRTFAVSFYSSKIHDESRKPLKIFMKIPQSGWCEESRRFFVQVLSGKLALSGRKFFHLTRKLILKIVGTIVTYELVLVQFHSEDKDINERTVCS